MAIKRCPYCKAIIDESSGYCSNCGTQLLFPEDESIEEEIPGEKIVEEEAEEESEESEQATDEAKVKEKEESKPPSEQAEPVESHEEPELKEEMKEDKEEVPSITPPYEEERLEEIEEPTPEASSGTGERYEEREEEPPPTPQDLEEGLEERKEPSPATPYQMEAESVAEEEPQKALDFRTEELEGIVDPAEKEKEEIDRFLDSIRKEREEKAPQEEEITPDFSEIKEKIPDTGEEIPPWAEKIKDSTSDMDSFSKEEEIEEEPLDEGDEFTSEEERAYEEKTPAFDSGVGIPERVSQRSLPFEKKKIKKPKGIKINRPTSASSWLKSKVFDFLFIGAFWLIALWFASRVMEVSLFKLISVSVLPVLIFYLVLLTSYFLLFLYFLGETIGEHLFSQEE